MYNEEVIAAKENRPYSFTYGALTLLVEKHLKAMEMSAFKPTSIINKLIDVGVLIQVPGSNKMYFRLTNKKQFELNEDGQYKVSRVKSIMNYLKSSIYFLKVDFEQSEYYQEFNISESDDSLSYNYDNIVSNSLSGIDLIEFQMTMNDVSATCQKFLETIPYDKNSAEWLNIYVSTMLTFLNMVTLPNKSKKRLEHLANKRTLRQYHYEDFYEAQEKPILFHLPESMSDYILVLARQMKHLVGCDLSDILHTKVGNDVILIKSLGDDYAQEVYDTTDED